MNTITKTITRVLARKQAPTQDVVHFHGGAQGAYVCENAHCVSPALDPAER